MLRAAACALALIGVVALGGCGSDEKVIGGTAKGVMPTPPDYLDPQLAYTTEGGEGGLVPSTPPPDYLDPQLAYTTEAAEADWIAYTPLLTYRHKGGADGSELIPGLAQRLPRISPDGRRYRLALRRGLTYSNGRAVSAGDFEYTIERAIRLGWPGKRFLVENIVGARAFDQGQAEDISGIETDDA